jgi:hypothetical protein
VIVAVLVGEGVADGVGDAVGVASPPEHERAIITTAEMASDITSAARS